RTRPPMEPHPPPPTHDPQDPPVTGHTRRQGVPTRVAVRHHTLTADEPETVGGGDEGPTPYDLLAAALGTCTAMTLRMYADRKGWPLTGVTVQLTHDRVHAEDCRTCDTEDGHIDRFHRAIAMDGPLSDEQRQRLLEIADRCPVHRTLTGEVVIETELAPPDLS
ncbi:MAG: OsmC family protein, partial [Rhodothermales bacterium]|nr:OsmC family protein [Rhodothermales bacterium]